MFVVIWLNLVLQPCAMALGGESDHKCPRCPPKQEHNDHAMRHGQMPGHDMAHNEMPCATDATDCSLFDELNYDGRIAKLEVNDAPTDCPIAIDTWGVSDANLIPAQYRGWYSSRSPPRGKTPPLNVLYCVYLK